MKYLALLVLTLVMGCGILKGAFEKKEVKETLRPPQPHEIVKNPDGTYTVIIDESLSVEEGKEGVNFTKWLFICGFIVAIGLSVKFLIMDFYEKELKKGYDR